MTENTTGDAESIMDKSLNQEDFFTEGWIEAQLEAARELRKYRGSAPSHLSEFAMQQLQNAVLSFSRDLAREAARLAQAESEPGQAPEVASTMVRKADSFLRHPDIAFRSDNRSRLAGSILLSMGTIGSASISGFLNAPWQWLVFAICVTIGTAGLLMTWLLYRV